MQLSTISLPPPPPLSVDNIQGTASGYTPGSAGTPFSVNSMERPHCSLVIAWVVRTEGTCLDNSIMHKVQVGRRAGEGTRMYAAPENIDTSLK